MSTIIFAKGRRSAYVPDGAIGYHHVNGGDIVFVDAGNRQLAPVSRWFANTRYEVPFPLPPIPSRGEAHCKVFTYLDGPPECGPCRREREAREAFDADQRDAWARWNDPTAVAARAADEARTQAYLARRRAGPQVW